MEKEIRNSYRLLAIFLLVCLLIGLSAQMGRLYVGEGQHLFDGDGFFYYVYLPNLFFKKNLDFGELYAKYHPQGPMWSRIVPETGRWSNVWSVGPALMWAPGFLLGHLVWLAAQPFGGPRQTDGFDLYHEGGAAFASGIWALLAILICYRLARQVTSPRLALAATIIIWLGTPLLNYGFFEVDMSHGVGALVFAALFYTALLARKRPACLRYWLGCGALIGLAMLIRPQHIILLLVPLGAWALSLWETHRQQKPLLPMFFKLVPLLVAIPLVFLPQMLAWKAIFGNYLVMAQPNYFADLQVANIGKVLFSVNHGFFSWTPIWLLCLIGLYWTPKEIRWLAGLIVLVWIGQVVISAWAADWGGGEAFGARRLTEIGPGLGLGLAALLGAFRTKPQQIILGGIIVLLVAANLALLVRYCLC